MKLLFVAGGSPATVFALSPLATAARIAGHEVFMAATEDMMPTVAGAGLPGIPVTPLPIRHFISTDRSGNAVEIPKDPVEEALFTGRWFGRMAAASLGALRDLARDWRPDVVVGGTMSYAAPLLAHELQVPYVRHAWDAIEATGIDPGAEDELRPELAELGLDRVPDPDLFIDICPPSLRPPDAGPAQMMRWIPGNRQRRLEPWMYTRGERRRICVTSGSRVAPDSSHSYLRHAYEFLYRLTDLVAGLDAEIVVAAPEAVAADLRSGRDGIRADWIPLDVVAPTCDLLVHHSGGVTSLTAMNAGIPQLLIPQGAVLVPAAQRVADYGAAITLRPGEGSGEGSDEAIVTACRELLSNPSYAERARALSAEIAALPLPVDVVGALEKLALT